MRPATAPVHEEQDVRDAKHRLDRALKDRERLRATKDDQPEAYAAAESEVREARKRMSQADATLRKRFSQLTAEAMVADARAARRAFTPALKEATTGISASTTPDRLAQAAAERRAERLYERQQLKEMELQHASTVDPTFEQDRDALGLKFDAADLLHPAPWNNMISYKRTFGQPPPVPNPKYFKYPPPPRVVPPQSRLSKIAKYRGCDRVVLQKSASEPKVAAKILRVEMGDPSQHPREVSKEFEAVYLVQTDSTTTTVARGAPRWVNERELVGKLGRVEKVGLGATRPGWSRRWPGDLTFDALRERTLRELDKKAAEEERRRDDRSLMSRGSVASRGSMRTEATAASRAVASTRPW